VAIQDRANLAVLGLPMACRDRDSRGRRHYPIAIRAAFPHLPAYPFTIHPEPTSRPERGATCLASISTCDFSTTRA
jgi:hypothetical protein